MDLPPHPPAPAVAAEVRGMAKAQLGLAVAAAAFALFASTLDAATFSSLPAPCVATVADILALALRYNAAILLLWAIEALVIVLRGPASVGRLLRGAAFHILSLYTLLHLVWVVMSTLHATGALCFGGSVYLVLAAIVAATFLYVVTWVIA